MVRPDSILQGVPFADDPGEIHLGQLQQRNHAAPMAARGKHGGYETSWQHQNSMETTCTLITINAGGSAACKGSVRTRALKPWAHTPADECGPDCGDAHLEEVRDMDDLKIVENNIREKFSKGWRNDVRHTDQSY
jgi:hypothetical protein